MMYIESKLDDIVLERLARKILKPFYGKDDVHIFLEEFDGNRIYFKDDHCKNYDYTIRLWECHYSKTGKTETFEWSLYYFKDDCQCGIPMGSGITTVRRNYPDETDESRQEMLKFIKEKYGII